MTVTRNPAASAHARLLAKAKAGNRPFDEVLTYYGIERFLYRLGRTPHVHRFVLKGALMLPLWGSSIARATRDIDMLGTTAMSPAEIDASHGLQTWMADGSQTLVPTLGVVFDLDSLVAKLRHIEALFAGATTPGERDAADAARERISRRLLDAAAASPPVEMTYTLQNPWSKMLFVALARRYGLQPYRYRRQRFTTVILRVSPRFSDETLWPEFIKLDRELTSQLDALTKQVIASAIHDDTSDAAERDGQLALPETR